MNFDYTYIILGNAIIFEPMTILTNFFITLFCIFAFFKIKKFRNSLAIQWSSFFLMIGLSSTVGSVAHGAHFQLGETFLRTTVFMMNSISLIAIFFCFKSARTFSAKGKAQQKKYADYIVILWICVLLIITFIQNKFLLIKIHAGIVLTYSMIVHFIQNKKGYKGGSLVAYGIIVSFLSIVVHSLKFSFGPNFNYKDISHVIMLISLIIMHKGVKTILCNTTNLSGETSRPVI